MIYEVGPMVIVTRIRLEHGAGLLLHSDMGIKSVAEQVGFSCARTFSQAFLQKYGMRPGAFRREAT